MPQGESTLPRANLERRIATMPSNEEGPVPFRGRPAIEILRILRREQIPLLEMHVLVRRGLSTYVVTHSFGTTFVVNTSVKNPERERDLEQALVSAEQDARSRGLQAIYLLE